MRPIDQADWSRSSEYRRGVNLFNAGYYWEAHEVWEGLWHAHERAGPTADLLRALIKLAAAGVKVRQGQPHGTITHAARAAGALARLRAEVGPRWLGIDLGELERAAAGTAASPPHSDLPLGAPAEPVLGIQLCVSDDGPAPPSKRRETVS